MIHNIMNVRNVIINAYNVKEILQIVRFVVDKIEIQVLYQIVNVIIGIVIMDIRHVCIYLKSMLIVIKVCAKGNNFIMHYTYYYI